MDLENGEVRVEGPCRGELRDAVFDVVGGGWLLTSYALCRVAFIDDRVVIQSVARPRGMGNHQHRLLSLGRGRLGVCGWAAKSMAVIDGASGAVTERVRVVAPHTAEVSGDAITLLCPHGGERADLDPDTLVVRHRRPMSHGSRPVLVERDMVMVTGERRQTFWSVPHSSSSAGDRIAARVSPPAGQAATAARAPLSATP